MQVEVMYNVGGAVVANIAFDDFLVTDSAFPSSRCLSGSDDQWAEEEWLEPGIAKIDGENRPAYRVYLFSADEVAEDPDLYPWDAEHCARVLLAD